jgi:hypothetical protein
MSIGTAIFFVRACTAQGTATTDRSASDIQEPPPPPRIMNAWRRQWFNDMGRRLLQ